MSDIHSEVPNSTEGHVAPQLVDCPATEPIIEGLSRDELEMSSFFRDVLGEGLHRGVTMTNIVRLEGPDSYDMWEADMIAIWNSTGLYELVVEGLQPVEHAIATERRAHRILSSIAVSMYITTVSPHIRQRMPEKTSPHLMWLYLKSEYKRQNTYSLVYQLGTFAQLASEFDDTQSVSAFVRRFEAEHYKLRRLAETSSDPYRRDFGVFLDRDSTKRDFLLGFLSKKLKNVVDNLTTKDDLTYSMVKQKLDDLDSTEQPQTALVTLAKSSRPVVTKPSKAARKKRCNYCKKHFPSQANDHSWNKCERLRGKYKQKGVIATEVANMTTVSLDNTGSTTSANVPDLSPQVPGNPWRSEERAR